MRDGRPALGARLAEDAPSSSISSSARFSLWTFLSLSCSRPVMSLPFTSIYRHDFLRTAVAIPEVRVAEPPFNAERTIALAEDASARKAAVVLFPEPDGPSMVIITACWTS